MPKGITSGIIYIPLDVRWPRNRKFRALIVRHGLDGLAATSLYWAMACYCRENLSDGWVPADEIGALVYPLPVDQAGALVKLLTDYRLVAHSPGNGDGHSTGHSDGYSPGYGDGYSDGYLVTGYVKRNGTRAETLEKAAQLAERGRLGASRRWSETEDGPGYGTGHSGGQSKDHAQTETETETESSSRARPPATRPRATPDGQGDDDDDDLDQLIVAMLTVHGIGCTREQAAEIRDRILGRRNIAPGHRRPYIERALGDADGARKWAPPGQSAAARHPSASQLDPVTRRRAELLRTGQTALDSDVSEDPHAQADLARKMLANRVRPADAPAADGPGELHGQALARAQLAEAQRLRARDQTGPGDPGGQAGAPDDDGEHEPLDEPLDDQPADDEPPPDGDGDDQSEYPF